MNEAKWFSAILLGAISYRAVIDALNDQFEGLFLFGSHILAWAIPSTIILLVWLSSRKTDPALMEWPTDGPNAQNEIPVAQLLKTMKYLRFAYLLIANLVVLRMVAEIWKSQSEATLGVLYTVVFGLTLMNVAVWRTSLLRGLFTKLAP